MNPDLAIREARREDLPAIRALLADDEFSVGREGGADEAVECAFDRLAADPNSTVFVLVDGGALVGCGQLTTVPGLSRRGMTRGVIEGVRVSSACRNRGYGRFLIAHLIERAREAGCGTVSLTSDKRRVDAHRFYRTLGFAQSHEGFKLMLE